MTSAIAALLQIGGITLAPLVTGTIQNLKALLQGRRGPGVLQPYRTLRRLWRKSSVLPDGAGIVYRTAPLVVAACALLALAIVPVAGQAGAFGVGHDALVLVGVLALSRLTLALSAWDTGNGFGLMGAARDLMIAVFNESLLLLALLVAALGARTTDLLTMARSAAGMHVWSEPAHWCGLVAFCLVVLVESGRQPIDNPDTHLELTMIHEGPLLEYAGRDLALLQWSAHARQLIVVLLAAQLFLPHPAGFGGALAALVVAVFVQCVLLATVETAQAKMRTLRVPALLGLGCLVALAGVGIAAAGVVA